MSYAHRTRPVLIAVDGHDDGDRALQYGIAEAGRRDTGIRLVHVLHPPFLTTGPAGPHDVPSARDVGAHLLKDAVERAHALDPDLFVEGSLVVGGRAVTLAEEADDAACVVLGTRQHGPFRFFGGSTSTRVAARAGCPVICVPPGFDPDQPAHDVIAVGVDEYGGPAAVLEEALQEAARRHARLDVVHAWQGPEPSDPNIAWLNPETWIASTTARLAEAVADVAPRYPDVDVRTRARFFEGPRLVLPTLAGECDLLVLGRQEGGVPLQHHLGSTTRHVIHAGTGPVMVVPVPEDED